MHELSIAQNIVDLVLEKLPESNKKILAVNIKVGEVSGVIPDSLEFCFNIIIKDTKLQGAKLNIERVSATAFCNLCNKTFLIEHFLFTCPSCNGNDIKVLTGTELMVTDIILDD